MIVGGLPEAVANYAKYKDWVRLNDIFNSLIAGYKDDIEKYAKKNKEQDILRYILNYGWGLAGTTLSVCQIRRFFLQVVRDGGYL